jgi:hypothetical protein
MFLRLYLQLHWNMIRLEGAEVLCNSLRTNRVLTNLDLSYNALGSAAAGVLGAALMENSVSGSTLCLAAYLTCFFMTATHQRHCAVAKPCTKCPKYFCSSLCCAHFHR